MSSIIMLSSKTVRHEVTEEIQKNREMLTEGRTDIADTLYKVIGDDLNISRQRYVRLIITQCLFMEKNWVGFSSSLKLSFHQEEHSSFNGTREDSSDPKMMEWLADTIRHVSKLLSVPL